MFAARSTTRSAWRRLVSYTEFEIGRKTPIANNIAAMRRAIEAGGLRLLFDKEIRMGLRQVFSARMRTPNCRATPAPSMRYC
jgi:hypothetical protein